MSTKCFAPILGKRLRVTELDECGRITPTSRSIVTSGFVTVSLSAEVEEGTEIVVRNAAGQICINEKLADSFKRLNVELTFCGVNPSLLAMVTNAKEYEDHAGDVAGFTIAEGEMTGKFALELWTGLTGQECGDEGEASGYLLLPLVNSGTLADLEIGGEDAINFGLTNSTTKGGNSWGVGPLNVVLDTGAPAKLPTALDPLDHMLMIDTELAPPPADCEPTTVGGATITTVAPATGDVAGGTVVTVTGTGFTTATAVNFGGTPGTAFSVTSDTEVKATTPAHAAGAVNVTVVRPGGSVTKTNGFTYA